MCWEENKILRLVIGVACLMGCSLDAISQYTLAGKVVDANTRQPLPFVNIIINHDALAGTTSDINGTFRLHSLVPIDSLTCSYVGYEKITIGGGSGDKPILIAMREADILLGEVVVRAGENPAFRIIRQVIANKPMHNPENISSYSCRSYNKVIYDFDFRDSMDMDAMETLDEVFGGGHVFLMESVTERKFIRPDNLEEKILGVKISGFKDASFAPLATDIQPFSFYKDIIPILDIEYLNPISQGSLSKYDFSIKDTLWQGRDTVFVIAFTPLEGKNFVGLKGLLYINTRGYAVQNVLAEPYERGFIDISIQQQYALVDARQWFPQQLKFEMVLRQSKSMTVGVRTAGVSIIDSVRLDVPLRKSEFGIDAISMQPDANSRDSTYWMAHRAFALDAKEETTYRVVDSLGEKYKFDLRLKWMEQLGKNRIPIGPFDIDISKLLLYNKFEGIRLGFGLYTNDHLIRNVSAGGYFGYGFKDHQWKYGGEMKWMLNKEHELEVVAAHDNTLVETGKSYLTFFRPRQFDFRKYLASQMDRVQRSSLSVGGRIFRYAQVNVGISNARIDPQYAYTFQSEEGQSWSHFTNTALMVNLRYAHKEKLLQSLGQRISMGTRYPIISLSYTRGLKDVFGGQFYYHKLEARLEESLYIRNLGTSKFQINAGYTDQPLPYGLLFTGEGSYIRNWSVLIRNSFQTVTPYEFLSDRYADVHYSHDFGSLLFHIGRWAPSITLHQNMGWGTLSHPEYHEGVPFKTREKGLFESGLQLDNLVKTNYLNVSYLGFGAGMFYRYGPYAEPAFGDNLAFTFSMTFTTR